ncbi:toll-like receptor 6 [Branchiostoma floridae x Branchiostoma belcheri]
MSDKMEDMKNQVKAVTSAFDEPIISKGYDFFIIYCGKNSAVVNGIIIPRLKELNITYCEHQEHFIAGRDIFTNIQDCISQSRKILAVFSEDFFASDWCRKDLDMAMVQATEKQIVHFIAPIKIDDCVIPDKYGDLKNITYSDLTSYPKDWGEQIRCSLASIRVASMQMEICMCTTSAETI